MLGVLPGIVGGIQATEAIKLILGSGEPLVGRLLLFDALEMRFRELKLRKDPKCPICGDAPDDHGADRLRAVLRHHAAARGARPERRSGRSRVKELKARLDRGDHPYILDVRNPEEWQIARLDGAHLIPLRRAAPARRRAGPDPGDHRPLQERHAQPASAGVSPRPGGFRKLKNLKGGIDAWADEVDPSVPRY